MSSPIRGNASLVPLDPRRHLPHDGNVVRSLVVLTVIAACTKTPTESPATIVDLSTSTAELQRVFDAKAGEARFLTLLSPT
jgi:hypothetical protein